MSSPELSEEQTSDYRVQDLTLEHEVALEFLPGALAAITAFAFVSSRAGEPLFGRPLLPD